MAAKQTRRPRWYFSLRSPYSYLAYRDLVDRYPDVADALEWIPAWEPDKQSQQLLDEASVALPSVPMARDKHFYILQDARRLSKARGLTTTWPVDRDPQWEVAHLGYLVADAAGRGRRYVDLVYRARWEHGRDISDRATIGDIASELDLPVRQVADASDDPDVRRRGVQCLVESSRDGVFGVPFFVFGREKFFGVDRLRAVVALARGAALPEDPVPLGDIIDLPEMADPGWDAGHAGGCG